jgi:opacity protein-like surface antigen
MVLRSKLPLAAALAVALGIIPIAASAQQPTSREYPTLYKSPRSMGMGGAYVAVGGRTDTLFYNPAGLSAMPQDKGWEVNLLGITAEYSRNAKDFVKDLGDALDTQDTNGSGSSSDEELQAVNNVLAKYRGKDLHARVADFTSIGKSYDRFAFGIGGIANARIDALAHQGFGADGFLEVNADATYGGIAGASYALTPNIAAGLAIKVLHRETLIHNFSEREFVDNQDKLDDYIQKDLRKGGDAVGVDAGIFWKFAPISPFKPTLGLSVLNIGNLTFGKAGKIPQSVNIGVSVNPTIPLFRSLTVAADYIDILNNFDQDKDVSKRLRYGAEIQLFDVWPAEMAVRAGMYEGYPTVGADLRLFIFMLSYTMYTEEIGAYAGQDKDKRQLLMVNIGW